MIISFLVTHSNQSVVILLELPSLTKHDHLQDRVFFFFVCFSHHPKTPRKSAVSETFPARSDVRSEHAALRLQAVTMETLTY